MNLSFVKVGLIAIFSITLSACETVKGSGDERGESKLSARARSHTELGAAYFQQNKLEIALDEFKYAAEIDPNYAQAYNGLGLVYAALGEDAKADKNFKKAIQVEPRNSESHNNYGSFLCARKRYY